ncbi:hypothetical protein Aperf_G00000021007 [Anoplocephala perfoliata]
MSSINFSGYRDSQETRQLLYHITETEGCRYKCNFTNDIHELSNGDVAVFSEAFGAKNANDLKFRGVWIVFESAESPVHMRKLSDLEANSVDMFITYMPWSEVPFMYPMFLRNQNPGEIFSEDEVAAMLAKDSTHLLPSWHYQRTKLVAWMASNSQPKNNRDSFVHVLQKYVPVDIYGALGEVTPPGRDPFQWMSEHYKFYLAFENSNCKFYITEKATSNALRYGMVPIVMGAHKEDYMSILPPHSYINVDDFKTFQELSDYLLYLDKNHTAYAEYFAWTEYGRIYVC